MNRQNSSKIIIKTFIFDSFYTFYEGIKYAVDFLYIKCKENITNYSLLCN